MASGLLAPLRLRGIAMRFRVRKAAHFLERIGLAMAGASSGLFVGLHVGSSFAALTSQGFIVVMMIGGAIGFYLGIDTPPLAFHGPSAEPSKDGYSGEVDTAEFQRTPSRRVDLAVRSDQMFAGWTELTGAPRMVRRTGFVRIRRAR